MWVTIYGHFKVIWMESRDVSVERAQLLEGAGAVTAFELVLVLDVVHALDVGAEVAALRELHAAEGAGVRLLARVLQHVSLETLLLGEAVPAVLADKGPLTGVDALVPDHLGGLHEPLATKLAVVSWSPVFYLCFRPFLDKLQTRFYFLVLDLMLPKIF